MKAELRGSTLKAERKLTADDVRAVRVMVHTVSGETVGVDMPLLNARTYAEYIAKEGIWVVRAGTSTYYVVARVEIDAEIDVPDGAPKRVA